MAGRVLMERRAASALDSLAAYTRYMWPVIEPGTALAWNWHLDVVCGELEAVTRGECRELVICVPPGTCKSILVSVMWPTWQWLRKPYLRGLHVSNSDRLGVRDSRRARDIIQSDQYERLIRAAHERLGTPTWALSSDQAEKVHFATTEGGSRLSLPTQARITGDRGDMLVIDDPIDAQEAVIGSPDQIAARMEEVQHRYDHVWASRLNNPKADPRVVIMQRLAPGDLAGVLISRGVRAVVLPMEYEPDAPHKHPLDPRREAGELLFPARFPRDYVDRLKSTPGASRHYAAQYQQRPSPLGGGVFRPEWRRYYLDQPSYYQALDHRGEPALSVRKDMCSRIMTADTALSSKALADYTVVQVWDVAASERGPLMFLVDQWREQAEAPTVEQRLLAMVRQYSPAFVGIEESTASLAVLQRLQREGLPVRGLKPSEFGGDKVSRAYTASISMEAGRIYFPKGAPLLIPLEAELDSFPGGQHDDQCLTADALVLTGRGSIPIADVRSGDWAATRLGWCRVVASVQTSKSAPIYRLTLDDGTTLDGTANHPIFTENRGWVSLRNLVAEDTLSTCANINQQCAAKPSFSMESRSGVTQTPPRPTTDDTTSRTPGTYGLVLARYIKRFGRLLTVLSRRGTTFTTKTATRSTTTFPTLSALRGRRIGEYMPRVAITEPPRPWRTLSVFATLLRIGTVLRRVETGIGNTLRTLNLACAIRLMPSAAIAGQSTSTTQLIGERSIALERVHQEPDAPPESTTNSVIVPAAVARSIQTSIAAPSFAVPDVLARRQQKVVNVTALNRHEPVYNLTVDGAHEFYANGVLVHNCDALAYAALHADEYSRFAGQLTIVDAPDDTQQQEQW